MDQAGHFLRAHRLDLRFVKCFEVALTEIRIWSPHLLLLDYAIPNGAMAYETFVHAQLPLVDPYRMNGLLADNPWRYTAMPILLVAGEPLLSTPGLLTPHLPRVAHFVPKPCEPSHVLPLVEQILPESKSGIILNPDEGWVEVQGTRWRVSARSMDLLVTLAQHHPQPLTATQLARYLFRDRGVSTTDTGVRSAIHWLRQRLEAHGIPPLVNNQRYGYFLTHTPTLISS